MALEIYIDNSLLIRWFLSKFYPESYNEVPQIIKFLSTKTEIKKYISLMSIAELVRTLKYGEKFERFGLSLRFIHSLIEEMQSVVGFDIILRDNVDGTELNGIIISGDIIKLIDKHRHLIDCIHVDIAKSHDLTFVTYEKKIGRMKEIYDHILTENKLMKLYS